MFRRGIMATQLLATLTIVYHLLRCGIVVYLVNLRHLFHSIPLEVCFVSQLERWFYVSIRELLDLREDRFFRSCPFPPAVMLVGVLGARHQDKDGD